MGIESATTNVVQNPLQIAGVEFHQAPATVQIEHIVDLYERDAAARGLSPRTLRRYDADLLGLLRYLTTEGIFDLCGITADVLRGYFAFLLAKPNGRGRGKTLSRFSVEGYYRSVKAFFNWCTWEHWIESNPMEHVRPPKLPKRIVQTLDDQQMQALLDFVEETHDHERNLAMMLLMVGSGLRRGELLGMKIQNVEFMESRPEDDNGAHEIGRVRVIGKGDKERDVPISPVTVAALKAWLEVRPRTLSDHVFVTASGTPLTADGLRSLMKRLHLKMHVPRLYPHLLRHTFATMYLKRGDEKSLQQILGHSKSSTTLDMYVHFDFNDLKQIYKRSSPVDALKENPRIEPAHAFMPTSAPGGPGQGPEYLPPNQPSRGGRGFDNILKRLTEREIEVCRLVARGYLDPEISKQLEMSERTAGTHVHNVLRKLQLSRRDELVELLKPE